jgi:hypothetical protein
MFRDPRELRIDRLLTQPFRDDPADAAGKGDRDRTLSDLREADSSKS